MTRKTAILISCLAILLGAGLLAYGVLSHDAESRREPQTEAEKLAELEAALIEAAATGKAKQADSEETKQLPPPRPTRTRST
jgi:hypothetical protein